MPGFTSVNYQQPTLLQPPPAMEQAGGGIGNKILDAAKTTYKAGKMAAKYSSKGRPGFVPFAQHVPGVLQKGLATAKKFDDVVKKTTAAATKLGKTTTKAATKVGKAGKTAISNKGVISAVTTDAGTAVAKTSRKVAAKLKNKKVGRELAKRLGKKTLMTVSAAGITAGVTAGAHYFKHRANGGEALSGKDVKKIAGEATVNIIEKALDGQLKKQNIQEEVIRAYNNIISTKRGGKTVSSSTTVVKSIGSLVKMLEKLNKIHARRHVKVHGEEPMGLEFETPFGSGAMKKKSGKRGGKKKPKGKNKKKCKSGKKKCGNKQHRHKKPGKSRRKLKRMVDIFDVYT